MGMLNLSPNGNEKIEEKHWNIETEGCRDSDTQIYRPHSSREARRERQGNT